MPITAKTSKDDMVIASDLQESDRAKDYYFCRFCGSEMKLVLPKKNIVKHFRHVNGCDCAYSSESIAHLEAKYFFYNLYKKNNLYDRVEIESGWNGIEHDRVGDMVLYPKTNTVKPTVIEIQNSAISKEEIADRFVDWNAFDLTPSGLYAMMWIITDNVIHPLETTEEIIIPKWVRNIHKIYMGRVYIYSNTSVYAAHFDSVTRYNDWSGSEYYLKTKKNVSTKKINNYNILQTKSGGGKYGATRLISRFYDKKFW